MKVKLLNNSVYDGMENVKFPVIVEGVCYEGLGVDVLGSELISAGASNDCFDEEYTYYFSLIKGKCEVIEE